MYSVGHSQMLASYQGLLTPAFVTCGTLYLCR